MCLPTELKTFVTEVEWTFARTYAETVNDAEAQDNGAHAIARRMQQLLLARCSSARYP